MDVFCTYCQSSHLGCPKVGFLLSLRISSWKGETGFDFPMGLRLWGLGMAEPMSKIHVYSRFHSLRLSLFNHIKCSVSHHLQIFMSAIFFYFFKKEKLFFISHTNPSFHSLPSSPPPSHSPIHSSERAERARHTAPGKDQGPHLYRLTREKH